VSINEVQLKRLLEGLSIQATMSQENYVRVSTDVIENLVSTVVEYQRLNREMEKELTRLVLEKNNG
jgi:radical SAM superfamily enzyme